MMIHDLAKNTLEIPPEFRRGGKRGDQEMIDFLKGHVADERFGFQHMNSHNEMYNTEGVPLADHDSLPVGNLTFDIICLYSVFTHLAPHDYSAMLKLLRPYIKPQGKLIFSLFIDETTEGGHGLCDAFARQLGPAQKQPPPFADLDSENPLR